MTGDRFALTYGPLRGWVAVPELPAAGPWHAWPRSVPVVLRRNPMWPNATVRHHACLPENVLRLLDLIDGHGLLARARVLDRVLRHLSLGGALLLAKSGGFRALCATLQEPDAPAVTPAPERFRGRWV